MNTTLACVFPETLPDEGLLFPLVQVFEQVVHMQAVENEPLETTSNFVHHCQDRGRLQTFTPAPLGEQRQRFMALVADMRRHGADYTSQLSMLTLAGLNRGAEQRESTHALIADLLQRTDIREKEEEQLQLWQSRLMLKLGEWSDLQQADIDSTLIHIASRQNALLQELREEEDNPFSLTAGLDNSSRETDAMLSHRLKAWSQLYFYAQDQAPGILVTRHAMVIDLLQEFYEKLHSQPLTPLMSLDLPLMAGDEPLAEAPLINQIPTLRATIAQLMQPLAPEKALSIAKQWATDKDAWGQLLDKHYPHQQAGRCHLEFIYFPGISGRRLIMEGFARGMQSGEQNGGDAEQGCCVAFLRIV
ncbi:MAG: hypothetical protein AB7U29_12280 [Desulfobulbus sp.]